MKAIKFIISALIVVFFVACTTAQTKSDTKTSTVAVSAAENTSATLKVSGNCEMCKERIEKAAKIEGVATAEWISETKLLTVSFDSTRINIDAIAKAIAASGHDNEKVKADEKVYGALPGCCQYDR